jgi:predicted acetyltransferase
VADVTLEPAGPERLATLGNLFQLYVHDFSEQWFDRDGVGDLDEAGLFQHDFDFAKFWTQPGCSAWLIRADGHLAGFALLGTQSHSGVPADHDVAEFFVARKYRRDGVGYSAARALIGERPGRWEIAVTRRNVGAQHFWRRVANDLASGPVEDHDLDDAKWNGLILRFRVATG